MNLTTKARPRRRTAERRTGMFKRSPIPLDIQVATLLRNRITEGQMRPGERMPTLDELEREFGVARVTVRQAVELLEKEGLVRREQGRGTFVTPNMRERRWLHLTSDMDSLSRSIGAHVPRFVAVREPLPPRLLPGDGRAADSYQYLLSVQYRAGEPFAVASVHVARTIFDRAPREFRTHAQLTVVVGSADPVTSERLSVPLNSPTAEARYLIRDRRGIVTYVAEVIYRGDCVRFDIDLLRNGDARG